MIYRRLTALGVMLVATSLHAQENTGVMLGVVRDASGKPLEGVKLTLKGAQLLGGRTATSGPKGDYRFPILLPGTYTLTGIKDDYVGVQVSFRLSSGQILQQNLKLRPVTIASTTVEVRDGDVVDVDKTTTSVATTLSMETIRVLPSLYWSSGSGPAYLAPGVFTQGDSTNSIRGGVTNNVVATVDGISIREPARGSTNLTSSILPDMVADFSVVQSPMNARYGNSSSGLFVTTTKTGTNTFQGSIRCDMSRGGSRPQGGRRLNRFASPLSESSNGSPYLDGPDWASPDEFDAQWDITLSGPIIKDKLTFTYGTRITRDEKWEKESESIMGSSTIDGWKTYLPGVTGPEIPGVIGPDDTRASAGYLWKFDPTQPTKNRLFPPGHAKKTFHTGKLFWQLSQNHQIAFTFTQDTRKDNYWREGFEPEKCNPYRTIEQTAIGLSYEGLLTSASLLTIKYGQSNNIETGPGGYDDPITFRGYEQWSNPDTLLHPDNLNASRIFRAGGNEGSALSSENKSQTLVLNYQHYTKTHNIDVGMEILREGYNYPYIWGFNNRAFYTPGRRHDGQWMVYKFEGSPADIGDYSSDFNSQGDAWTTEMIQWDNSTNADPMAWCQNIGYYVNDLWTINSHWTVMGGIRFEQWRITDLLGTRVNSSAPSLRAEVKWDPKGDSRHVFSLSYGQFRGSFSPSRMSGHLTRQGSSISRRMWAEGDITPHFVSETELKNPSNYSLYAHRDRNLTFSFDKNLKPELTQQVECSYHHGFQGGGKLRLSYVFRKLDQLFGEVFTDTKAPVRPDLPANSPITNYNVINLTKDPYARDYYRSVEMEWDIPIKVSDRVDLDFGGNYTYAKDANRSANNTVLYSKLDDLGLPLDFISPYLQRVPEQSLKVWLTWNYKTIKNVSTSISLLAQYNTGAPILGYEGSWWGADQIYYRLPSDTFDAASMNRPKGFYAYTPSMTKRTELDGYSLDIRWNTEYPLVGRVKLFTDITIINLLQFNRSPMTYGAPGITDYRTWNRPGGDPNDLSGPKLDVNNGNISTLGIPGYVRGQRGYGISMGIRF